MISYREDPLRIVEIASAAPTVKQHLWDQWKPSTPYSKCTNKHMSKKPMLEPSSAHSTHLGKPSSDRSCAGFLAAGGGESTLQVTETNYGILD